MIAAGIRKGIWSRRIPATPLANLIQSIGYSGAFSIMLGIIKYVQYGSLPGAIATGVIYFIFMAFLCYAALSVVMIFYKKRKTELEDEEED